ncbi:MAG: anti-sigma factor family protein [Chlorobium sp.]
MNCKTACVLVSAAVDGEISFREEQVFLSHLSECQECREEFDGAKKTKMIIKERIIQFKAPQALIDSIMQLTDFNTREAEEPLLCE